MHNETKIKLKILNQRKNTDDEISLGAFAVFQTESHDHGRGLMR